MTYEHPAEYVDACLTLNARAWQRLAMLTATRQVARTKGRVTVYGNCLYRGDVGDTLAAYDLGWETVSRYGGEGPEEPFEGLPWPDCLGSVFHGDACHDSDLPLIAEAFNLFDAVLAVGYDLLVDHKPHVHRGLDDDGTAYRVVACDTCPTEVSWPCPEWESGARLFGVLPTGRHAHLHEAQADGPEAHQAAYVGRHRRPDAC